jgi:hypothetical protein
VEEEMKATGQVQDNVTEKQIDFRRTEESRIGKQS